MDIRTLSYFVVVAEELNITKAAEKLNMSQPPLSSQMKSLENELNTILFIRGKRHLKLTESGQLLYRRAKEILNFYSIETLNVIRSINIPYLTILPNIKSIYDKTGYNGDAINDKSVSTFNISLKNYNLASLGATNNLSSSNINSLNFNSPIINSVNINSSVLERKSESSLSNLSNLNNTKEVEMPSLPHNFQGETNPNEKIEVKVEPQAVFRLVEIIQFLIQRRTFLQLYEIYYNMTICERYVFGFTLFNLLLKRRIFYKFCLYCDYITYYQGFRKLLLPFIKNNFHYFVERFNTKIVWYWRAYRFKIR